MKIESMILALFLIVSGCGFLHAQEIWVGKDGNIRNVDARAMLIDEDSLYLATNNEIYRSTNIQNGWEPIFAISSGENEISCLSGGSNSLLVGTRRGLFRSTDGGSSWKNVFRTIIPEKSSIVAIDNSKETSGRFVIGTLRGVFATDDYGDRWRDISGTLKNRGVGFILFDRDIIYACADGGLYVKKTSDCGWQRIYVTSTRDVENDGDLVELEAEKTGNRVTCAALKETRLYIGADKKILYSDDSGASWAIFTDSGLSGYVNLIAPSKKSDKMYCATSRGIFEFDPARGAWLELYKGMQRISRINGMVLDEEESGCLWAVTDKGVFRLESGRYIEDGHTDIERNLKSMKLIFDNEPSFARLQKAALKFAELDPEKIRQWRVQARLRAILPKVSFDMDNNSSTTYEIYTSTTRDYTVLGPDDVTRGCGVSLSWELGDLIWSDDQTNIDVRSRLTTQLRNDVLDDLRRAYFERKRLQFELMTAPPNDLRARFDKEIRIKELGQMIDDLTGNYLSEHTENNPEDLQAEVENG